MADQGNTDGQVELAVVVDGGGERKPSLNLNSSDQGLDLPPPPPPPERARRPRVRFRVIWDELLSVPQRLVAFRAGLTERAFGWMHRARRFREEASGYEARSVCGLLGGALKTCFCCCCRSGDEDDSDIEPWWSREMALLREDIRRMDFWRCIVGEFVGSFFLVLVGCGASVETDHPEQPVTVRVALGFGVAYTAGLYCLHAGNDGHLNTAVTVAMAVTRRVSVLRSVLYSVTQIMGAIVAAQVLHWVTAEDYRNELGCTRLSKKVSEGQGFLVEFFATLVLVFVVFSSYDERNKDKSSLAPFIVGLTLISVSLFSVSRVFELS